MTEKHDSKKRQGSNIIKSSEQAEDIIERLWIEVEEGEGSFLDPETMFIKPDAESIK